MSQLYCQEQEQEDLMADFDGRSKERNVKVRGKVRQDKVSEEADCWKKQVPMRSTGRSESMRAADESGTTRSNVQDTNEVCTGDVSFDVDHIDGFTFESYTVLLEEIKKSFSVKVCDLRNMDTMNVIRDSFMCILDAMYELPNYEEELKYVTSISLICYGGSWTTLAAIVAAAEAFGTNKVVQAARKVGVLFLFDQDYYCEHDISPSEIIDTFRNTALHTALMIAVVVSPSWAEICITVAISSKFACLLPMQDFLKHLLMGPGSVKSELDDYFGIVDQAWFDLLSLFTCNIVSLILFSFFPRLITAMYMGYIGFVVLADALMDRAHFYIPILSDSELVFRESLWMQNTTQYYTWGIVALMAVWQAISGYQGTFLFISWLMFLFPIMHVYNIATAEEESVEGNKSE